MGLAHGRRVWYNSKHDTAFKAYSARREDGWACMLIWPLRSFAFTSKLKRHFYYFLQRSVRRPVTNTLTHHKGKEKQMNIKGKLERLAVAFLAIVGMLAPFGAWADMWEDDDGHVWTYSTNNISATVSAVTGAEYDMEIPATLGGKPVVAFGTIFKGNTKISEVVIPDSVTTIAANAFSGCSQLQSVTVGAGVMSVGESAFSSCSLLQKIELPATTTAIGRGAFACCVKLTTAKLPGVTSIPGADAGRYPGGPYFAGNGAFYGCDKLRTIQLGDNLTTIGNGAFYDCNELYDLVIPDSVTSIGNYAFAECNKLHSVTVGRSVISIGVQAFYNDAQLEELTFTGTAIQSIFAEAFRNCTNLQALDIPESVTYIGEYCFSNCDSIQTLTIPDSVTICTNGAFAFCDGLKEVKFGGGLTHIAGAGDGRYPGGPYFEGNGMLYGCSALTNVTLNAALRSIGHGAFYGCSALPEITIPGNVRTIGRYAFSACGLLKKVSIGDNVRLIDYCAFYDDAKLETVKFGAKVQTISESAFNNCSAMKNFTLPDTVLTIGDWAFKNCRSVKAVTLPDSVGIIGVGSFAYCTGLESVSIGDGIEEISGADNAGYGAFYGCTSLTNVKIGASVATIGTKAFYGCSALPEIEIPSCVSTVGAYSFAECSALSKVDIKNGGVTSIGDKAFLNDKALVTANLGNRLVTIGDRAFQYCTSLTGLTLPDSLITIYGWCFEGDTSLKSIVIPDKVKDLNCGAFAYCTGLESVKIGKTLAVIGGAGDGRYPGGPYFAGYGAFYGCTALRNVDFGTTLAQISCGAFYGCSSLASVTIPDSVTKVGGYAFGNCTSLCTVTLGTGVATMGNNVFDGDTALHYVEFKGEAAPANMGSNIYKGTRASVTTYVAEGSTGWTALYQTGLPETWQGKAITYAPPPEGAGNPYDFYVYSCKATVSRTDYYWSLMLTTNRYVHGKTVPASVTTIREGDTVYLSYAFDEYWRGEAFDVTNRFTLSGAKTGIIDLGYTVEAHSTVSCWWNTNAVPEQLQNLGPGEYTLTLQLNGDNRLEETDYSNNTTSIAFTVVGVPKYTVAFNLNGAWGPSPASRTIYEGKVVGELPQVDVPSGWTFLGWFTAAEGGTAVNAGTPIFADTVLYAHWQAGAGLYSIRFIRNDGAGTMETRGFGHGLSTPLPKVASLGFARKGMVFKGWATSSANASAGKIWKTDGAVVATPTAVGTTMDAIAVWELADGYYGIKFNKNDGTGKWRGVACKYGEATALPSCGAGLGWTRAGYTFMGWATSAANAAAGKVWKGDRGTVQTAASAGTTLNVYAIWEKTLTYTIKYGKYDGTGETFSSNYVWGVESHVPTATKSPLFWQRAGFDWLGWSTSPANADAGKVWKAGWGSISKPVDADGTLFVYACWRLQSGYYAIKFFRNDGTAAWRSKAFQYGVATRLPTVANGLRWSRAGYTFAGWATSAAKAAAGTVYRDDWGIVTSPVAAGQTLTLYAIWRPIASANQAVRRMSACVSRKTARAAHADGAARAATIAVPQTTIEPGYYAGRLADGSGAYELIVGDYNAAGYVRIDFDTGESLFAEAEVVMFTDDAIVLTTEDGDVYLLLP